MPGNWLTGDFPNLTEQNCTITSPMRNGYDCIAWAVGDTTRWWCPFGMRGVSYWPRGVPREQTVDAYVMALATCGFARCNDGRLENGIEKIALFATREEGELVPQHAARQLESGEWTSKLGRLEDISHDEAECVGGPLYGGIICYLSRPRPAPRI